jgi:hypothetical protein
MEKNLAEYLREIALPVYEERQAKQIASWNESKKLAQNESETLFNQLRPGIVSKLEVSAEDGLFNTEVHVFKEFVAPDSVNYYVFKRIQNWLELNGFTVTTSFPDGEHSNGVRIYASW